MATLRFEPGRQVIAHWRQRAEAELDLDGTPPDERTNVAVLRTGFGNEVHLHALLDPILDAEVRNALRRLSGAIAGDDRRAGDPAA